MYLLLSAAAVALCIIVSEGKELTASLVVLPPLVIGYDELYNDSDGVEIKPGDEQTKGKNEKLKEIIGHEETDKLIADVNKSTSHNSALRDTVIDVKGRRRNLRSVIKGRRRQKN